MRHFLRTAVRVVSSALMLNALSADGASLCADSLQWLCPIRLHFIYYMMIQYFYPFVKSFFGFFHSIHKKAIAFLDILRYTDFIITIKRGMICIRGKDCFPYALFGF